MTSSSSSSSSSSDSDSEEERRRRKEKKAKKRAKKEKKRAKKEAREEKRKRAHGMGVLDPARKYDMSEMASGDVIVCATGVTDGGMLSGVRFGPDIIETETIVYRSITGTTRRIFGEHRQFDKFGLE